MIKRKLDEKLNIFSVEHSLPSAYFSNFIFLTVCVFLTQNSKVLLETGFIWVALVFVLIDKASEKGQRVSGEWAKFTKFKNCKTQLQSCL